MGCSNERVLCSAWLTVAICCVSFATESESFAQHLSPAVMQAAEAARVGTATRGQKALLFKNNAAINQAALGGWLPDSTYQAAQQEYATINRDIARKAAEASGAEFTVQQSNSSSYAPGTDSDYIVTAKGSDPVGQIQEMQTRYNDQVNAYLDDALTSEGFHHSPQDNWHNRLDVDFMADPAHVTDQQFREIARLNNDAYTRRGSAEFERRSRAGGVEVTPGQFTDYANEMQDFIDKKQRYLEKISRDPASLNNPATMAEQHRLMAQEAKYTSRMEAANQLLREQEGLPTTPQPKGPPVYEILNDGDGMATIRKRPVGSVAQRGSKRAATRRTDAIAASGVAQNSVQRAVTELTESMAEAAAKNPAKWPNAQAQIAEVADRLPPAAKGQLLDRVAARRESAALQQILSEAGDLDDAGLQAARRRARQIGNDYSRGVAQEMRTRAQRPSMLTRGDNALRSALGVTDDMSQLRGLRGAANRGLTNAMGYADRLGMLGTVTEVYGVLTTGQSIFSDIARARDPNTSAAEARELYGRATADLWRLGSQGVLAGVSYAIPTAGAMIGGYDMGYGLGRLVLDNTEIGRAIDAAALTTIDAGWQSSERFAGLLTEFLGGQSQRMLDEEQLRDIEASYWRALREGRIRMRPGVMTLDIAEMIRSGNLAGLRDLIEPGPNAPKSKAGSQTAETKPKPKKGPNDDLEWINQTFDPGEETKGRQAYEDLVAKGKSPFGPVTNPDRGEGIATRESPDYRARAEQLVRGANQSVGRPSKPDYRQRAQQIDTRVTAVQQERERQARIAEARRQEAMRQEALRQEQVRRQQVAAYQARQRQIAAEQARRQQVAAQQQARARQQQAARQQAAWNSYQRNQQMMQQQRQRQSYTPMQHPYGGLLPQNPNYGPSIFHQPYYTPGGGGY